MFSPTEELGDRIMKFGCGADFEYRIALLCHFECACLFLHGMCENTHFYLYKKSCINHTFSREPTCLQAIVYFLELLNAFLSSRFRKPNKT